MIRFIGAIWSCPNSTCGLLSPTAQYLQALILIILVAVQLSVFSTLTPNHALVQGHPRQEAIDRLRSLFGVGWFFEWPGGRHPLNSTWPWADVKPSLLVLWGVCWMFIMALPVAMSRSSSQPSPLSHHPRVFPTQKRNVRSYCYCYGPTLRHEHHHYCESCLLLFPSVPFIFV